MSELASLEEQLFYGSVEVRFDSVPGKYCDISHKSLEEIRNDETEKTAKSRSEPLRIISEQNSLIIPVIPAVDIAFHGIIIEYFYDYYFFMLLYFFYFIIL